MEKLIVEQNYQIEKNHFINTKTRKFIGRTALILAMAFCPNLTEEARAETGGYPYADAPQVSGTYNWGYKDCKGYCSTFVDMPDGRYYVLSERGFGINNCTDWAAFRIQQLTGVSVPEGQGMGHAYEWDIKGVSAGYVKDLTPEPGDIAQSNDGTFGHVGVVEDVTKGTDGNITSVRISEYNKLGDGNYSDTVYSSKNAEGKFIRSGTYDWDNFIDVNGEGVGINGAAVGSSIINPEPQLPGDPFGNIDKIRRYPGGVRVEGWAMDPNTTNPINVDIYSGDGTIKSEQYEGGMLADILRSDLQSIGNGNNHGFSKDFLLEDNVDQNICLYGINAGPDGKNRRFACSKQRLLGDTMGAFEYLYRAPGGMNAIGWAMDPDTGLPIPVHFYYGESPTAINFIGGLNANKQRDDVVTSLSSIHVGYGPNHGFNDKLPVAPGQHRVCAFAVNSPTTPGTSFTKIGCGDILVSNQPKGYFESVVKVAGGVALKGWTLDPDVYGPVDVHVYDDKGRFVSGFPADQSRLDIVPTNPGYGDLHGFSKTVAVWPDSKQLCISALNAGGTPGPNLNMGCKPI